MIYNLRMMEFKKMLRLAYLVAGMKFASYAFLKSKAKLFHLRRPPSTGSASFGILNKDGVHFKFHRL